MIWTIVNSIEWLSSIPDSFAMTGIVAIILIVKLLMFRPTVRPNAADLAAVSLVGFQFLPMLRGGPLGNIIHFITPFATALCGYFFLRITPLALRHLHALFTGIALFALILSSADLILLHAHLDHLSSFSSSQMASLHVYFPLLGGPTRNDGAMLLLALLPYACGAAFLGRAAENSGMTGVGIAAMTVVSTALAATFSRSIYLATLIFAVTIVIWAIAQKGSRRFVLLLSLGTASVCIAVLLSFGLGTATIETVRLSTATYQQRSTAGRIEIWRQRTEFGWKHPVMGAGGGSDGLLALAAIKGAPDLPFTARAYNAPLEIFLSSGLLGFAAYAIFLSYPFWLFLKRHPWNSTDEFSSAAVILLAGLLVIIARDMSYSSLVLHGATIVLTWMTVGLIQSLLSRGRL